MRQETLSPWRPRVVASAGRWEGLGLGCGRGGRTVEVREQMCVFPLAPARNGQEGAPIKEVRRRGRAKIRLSVASLLSLGGV